MINSKDNTHIMDPKNLEDCANCRAYGVVEDKNGNPKDHIIFDTDENHPDGGYFMRDTQYDSEDDVVVCPCMSCAQLLDFKLGGEPYYGTSYKVGENNQPVLHFITLDEYAENSVFLYTCRMNKFLESFKIEDWCAKLPRDIQRKILEIWNS